MCILKLKKCTWQCYAHTVPPINMEDGPQGFRDPHHPGTSTAYPSGLTIAATFSPFLAGQWGAAMATEFKAKGANVLLGPAVNVARVPRNGRNFEYMSGEDPCVGAALVGRTVEGIQSQGLVATAKHWAFNNQETGRMYVSEVVDETTAHTIYYPPFDAAVRAGVGAMMCSYNKINGRWSCENKVTLKGDLKAGLGFEGFVMSDWGATHSTSIGDGLDMEMPSADYMGPADVAAAIKAGNATVGDVDESVRRILRTLIGVGVLDAPKATWSAANLARNVTTSASVALARSLAAAATVLLRNAPVDGQPVLPLTLPPATPSSPSSLSSSSFTPKSIAVVGLADAGAVVHGRGSGRVSPSFVSTPLAAIRNAVAAAGGGVTISYHSGVDINAAAAAAAAADVAIVFVGTLSTEGADRISLSLDDGCDVVAGDSQCRGQSKLQNRLVSAVARVQRRTIVVASVPGATLFPVGRDNMRLCLFFSLMRFFLWRSCDGVPCRATILCASCR